MKTKNHKGTLLKCLLIGANLTGPLHGQVDWNLGGNLVSLGTDYLGCNAISTSPLHLRTIPDLRIDFSTSNALRMTLNPTQTNLIGSTFTVPTDGFLGLGLNFPNSWAGTPWTRLHLLDAGYQPQVSDLFRDWMRNGVTMTSEYDQVYLGQFADDSDENARIHAVFQWGAHHDLEGGPSLARFIYAGPFNGALSGANSRFGKELLQLHPAGYAGVGDWNAASVAAGTPVYPTERLDVLDGNVRIRKLPSDLPDEALHKYLVVDNSGVVHWRPLPTSATPGCEWELNAGMKRVYSGWQNVGANGSCPDRSWRYSIGSTTANYKLSVQHFAVDDAGAQGGLYAFTNGLTGSANAIYGVCTPGAASGSTTQNSIGVYGLTSNVDWAGYGIRGGATGAPSDGTASAVVGVRGQGTSQTGTTTKLYGQWGYAVTDPSATSSSSYGLYGESGGSGTITDSYGVYGHAWGGTNRYSIYGRLPTGGTANWSGYFVGQIYAAGWISPSDAELKSEVQELQSASEQLMLLRPKTYAYRTEEYPHLGLPQGVRYGFIAQEVGEHFPQWVQPVHHPQELDSLGNVVTPSVDFMGLSTTEMIPLLVASVQEQHVNGTDQAAEIAALRERLNDLEQLLASCCASDAGRAAVQSDTPSKMETVRELDALHIQPNPFNERTTVYYRVANAGRAQLMANSADGKELRVLHEANLEEGSYQYEWNTADLAPGMYYVTLLVDGKPVVKKAVKVSR